MANIDLGYSPTAMAYAILAALLAIALMMAAPSAALAAGDGSGGGEGTPLAIEGTYIIQRADMNIPDALHPDYVDPWVEIGPKISVNFNKAVGYNTAMYTGYVDPDELANAEENASHVHLLYANGEEVENYTVSPGCNDSRRCLEIRLDDWLKPLTEYMVVVEPGVTARNGVDMLEEPYAYPFKTNGNTPDGLDVVTKIVVIAIIIAFAVGLVAAVSRKVGDRE